MASSPNQQFLAPCSLAQYHKQSLPGCLSALHDTQTPTLHASRIAKQSLPLPAHTHAVSDGYPTKVATAPGCLVSLIHMDDFQAITSRNPSLFVLEAKPVEFPLASPGSSRQHLAAINSSLTADKPVAERMVLDAMMLVDKDDLLGAER